MRVDHDGYGIADLHMHSDNSDGMASVEQILDYIEHETNLDIVAITDHDTLAGSLEAREIAARKSLSFELIPGAEITTQEGHLLALFIEQPVKSFQSVEKTIAAVHDQGGLCVVPHPMSWLTRSIGEGALDRVMAHRDSGMHVDGIELYNPTVAGRVTQDKTRRLNRERWLLAETGSSDSHFIGQIGSGYTIFSGRSAAELRAQLEARETTAAGYRMPTLAEIGYGQIVQQQVRSLVVWPSKLASRAAKRLMEAQKARAHHDDHGCGCGGH
jgi:hypothetical protein